MMDLRANFGKMKSMFVTLSKRTIHLMKVEMIF